LRGVKSAPQDVRHNNEDVEVLDVGDAYREKRMDFVSCIVVGSVVGWSAGKILKGDAHGPFMDLAMGTCGAVAGGVVMQSAGFSAYGGTLSTTLVAVMGALLLTMLAGFANGRRIYARQI
jgi:uncharacterized membrane protein YeaQ/YmgE (transglycosylase-associated protein family)